jgi:3-oxoacyl-[acyl-carrier-protein] synthase II
MSDRRVVVTGVGMMTPVGVGRNASWEALLNSVNGIDHTTLVETDDLPSRVSGEVTGFDATDWLDRKEARRMDRFTHLAIAASAEALEQSGLNIDEEPEMVGCMIGCGIGGMQTLEEQVKIFFEKGANRVSPFLVPMFIGDMAAGQVSIRFGARGPNYNTVSACASGADAIGAALETIKRGDATAMITGGAEAAVTRLSIAAFAASRALSRNADPETASRPFDAERDGFVLAEGAATLIIEEREHALDRGAPILAELIAYGQSADAFHVTQPSENGEGAARAMQMALNKAGMAASDIDYINAHGTSTPLNDKFETMSVKTVFGESALGIPVSSTKSMIGHTLGAAGGIEAAVTVMALQDQRIHGTRGLVNADPDCDLDYVVEGARDIDLNYAMSNSLGFGGHNSSLIFARVNGTD